MRKILIIFLMLFLFFSQTIIINADDCNIDCQINQVSEELKKSNEELTNQTVNYNKLSQQLENIKATIVVLGVQIKKGEETLTYQKQLLNERAKSYYKNINQNSLSLINLLMAENLSQSLHEFFYQKTVVDDDKNAIIKIVLYIKNLESEKIKLAGLKVEVDRQSQIIAGEISTTKQKIASLNTRQQQLIAQKLASLNISRSANTAGRCDSDLTNGRDPGFSPKFALFTYGVPNRVGLNQYGAYGRAKAGQNEEEILRAYYDNFELKKDYNTGININVDGYGGFNIEDYVKRVYEIPDSWTDNNLAALKAQAVAARSYALAYTNNGQDSICATEQCQVFKPEEKGGNWNTAVDATRGWVMVQGGSPVKAWFSSTHGGYIFKSGEIGWSDTSWTKHAGDFNSGVSSFSDLQNNAYDKESPWFYCDWGSRSEYSKTAWLRPEELADIINVISLARNLSTEDKDHLYQPDKPNPAGKETWDSNRVKSELRSRNMTVFNSVNDGSANADFGYGKTNSISFSGDGGSIGIDAGEFKNWFNLRAPANIQIVGPLFNVEKR